jgi:hypothetical protein
LELKSKQLSALEKQILHVSEQSSQTCATETFQARCVLPSKILVTEAKFGHIEVSKCIDEAFADMGQLGCYANITNIVQQRCGGNTRCDIEGDDATILATKQCKTGFPMYMDISYACVPG